MNMIRGYITVPKGCKYGNSSDINNIYVIEREICVQPIHIYINSIGRVSVLPTFWHCEQTLSDITSNHSHFTMSIYLSICLHIPLQLSLSPLLFISHSLFHTHRISLSFILSLSISHTRTHTHTFSLLSLTHTPILLLIHVCIF